MSLRQNIELLQRPQRHLADQLLDLRLLLITALALLCFWGLLAALLGHLDSLRTRELHQVQGQLDGQLAELAQLQNRLDPARRHAQRAALLNTLNAALSTYQRYAVLRTGYAQRLKDLAQLPRHGVWLTHIHYGQGSAGALQLEGRVLGSEYLSPYIDALQKAGFIHYPSLNQVQVDSAEGPTSSFILSEQEHKP